MLCPHLAELEKDLLNAMIPVTYRGQAWSDNCREWVYFDCVLDMARLKAEYQLPDFVKHHENRDQRSGTELGLVCDRCKDGIMGYLSEGNELKQVFPIR
jgi:hypothetical protein